MSKLSYHFYAPESGAKIEIPVPDGYGWYSIVKVAMAHLFAVPTGCGRQGATASPSASWAGGYTRTGART